MAQINVQMDTVTKKIDVTLDGQSVENVSEVTFYVDSYDDTTTGCVDIVSREFIENHNMMKTMRISADKQEVISQKSDTDTMREELSKAIAERFNAH